MVVEESVHYSITAPEAINEWLYNSPFGTGSVRLGPNKRGFFVSMFHELHCLRLMRTALASAPKSPMIDHSFHCLNYLRQSALCASDTTLEPGDFMQRDFTLDRIGATHVCRDWDPIYEDLRINWVEWYLYLQDRNISCQFKGSYRLTVPSLIPLNFSSAGFRGTGESYGLWEKLRTILCSALFWTKLPIFSLIWRYNSACASVLHKRTFSRELSAGNVSTFMPNYYINLLSWVYTWRLNQRLATTAAIDNEQLKVIGSIPNNLEKRHRQRHLAPEASIAGFRDEKTWSTQLKSFAEHSSCT